MEKLHTCNYYLISVEKVLPINDYKMVFFLRQIEFLKAEFPNKLRITRRRNGCGIEI